MASAYLDPPSPRRRLTAIALTIAVHVLLVLALINLSPYLPMASSDSGALSTFTVAPAPENRPRQRQRERTEQRQAAERPPEPTLPVPRAEDPPLPPGIIWMTREAYRATDVARLPNKAKREPGAEVAQAGADRGTGADDDGAIGTGPDGQPLYAARWQREPTNAELRTYLPAAAEGSWGMIACRTAPRNTVADCRTLGESPVGSGLATGMRRAAWQFRVMPPMRGGDPLIGAWVRIRIEFTSRGAGVAR